MPGSEAPVELEDIVASFARAATSAGVAYAFVGGVAVGAWGQPRTTADVDVLVSVRPHQVEAFSKALAAEGLGVGEAVEALVREVDEVLGEDA